MQNIELVELLSKLNYTISFAESCTGGLLADAIIQVNNSSKVINESFVTYSEESKMNRLGVKKETLDKYTVYSEEIAIEMAKGISKATNSTIGVGVTGVAGPTGGTPLSPVGCVYFSIYNSKTNECFTYRKVFDLNSRNEIRKAITEYIIDTIHDILSK
jgi:PncC family amidohydrolase